MQVDRRAFIASLGGSARRQLDGSRSKAEVLEHYNHKWYMEPRLVTVNDLYAFDPNAKVSIDPFEDIIGRHFKHPKEGLGFDNSPSAHMWRTLANPDAPL